MALTILYTATRASDFKSVTIRDNGTAFGQGGEMGTGDVTGITLSLFGTDKTTALKEVEFTSQERTDFLAGDPVTLLFYDTRLWYPTVYAPDNHYSLQLDISGGYTVSTQVAIDSWFYMKKIVNNSFTSTHTPQSTFYEANRGVVGNLVSLLQLQYESDIISLGEQICSYFVSAKIDAYGINDIKNADQYCIDCAVVRAMLNVLYFYQLNGTDTELTQTQLALVISTIHEYDYALLLNIDDFSVQVGSESSALGAGEAVVVLKSGVTVPIPRSYTWIVANDGDDAFQMPFDIAQVDSDSISLTLGDADPIYGDSYSITGTTLTWIGDYPLSSGWKFEIKWEA